MVSEVFGSSVTLGGVAFSPDGQRLAATRVNDRVDLWDLESGERAAVLEAQDWAADVAFSPDGELLATASRDDVIFWDAATGDEIAALPAGDVNGVALSPDGELLATAEDHGPARLWDVESQEPTAALSSSAAWLHDVAFSPDGKLLATAASRDGDVQLWDVATGDLVANLGGHSDNVHAVAFSPDGELLVTASRDSGILVRHLVLTPHEACALISHQVTRDALVNALGGDDPQACTELREP
jgi:WD40 repeat protein